jgi:hypothetical protein
MMPANLIAHLCPYKDGDAVFEARALLTWYDSIGTRYINPCEGITVASNRIDNTGNNININNTFLPVMDEKQIIHVYPNPAKNVININIINSLEKNFKIEIYSYNGELVYLNETIEKHIQIINIENWLSGIYLYKIFNDTFLQTGRVSVIK